MGGACCKNTEDGLEVPSRAGGFDSVDIEEEKDFTNLVSHDHCDGSGSPRQLQKQVLHTGSEGQVLSKSMAKRASLEFEKDQDPPQTTSPRAPPGNVTDEDACVLAWMLTSQEGSKVTADKLAKLHQQLAMCIRVTGAQVLVNEAWFGLIRGLKTNRSDMSDADVMLRLGQLMCRWAASQRVGIRMGVHVGRLDSVSLPEADPRSSAGPRTSYFGSAVAQAVHLATTAEDDGRVHLSPAVKMKLNAFRMTRLLVTPGSNTYSLDPATKVRNFFDKRQQEPLKVDASKTQQRASMAMLLSEGGAGPPMSFDEFKEFLSKHSVLVDQFGKGHAKTLEAFYEDVVQEKKSNLEVANGKVERIVSLVRISLRIRDSENKLRELRIATEAVAAGGIRYRDQQFAVVLKSMNQNNWQDSLEKCFDEKLQISPKVQKACFSTDSESYSYKEDRSASETIPGIMTTYKAHNIVINVKDKSKKELRSLGLPNASNFTLGTGANKKTWTWAVVGDSKEDELVALLQKNGIEVSDFSAQSFAELYDEIYERAFSTLEMQGGELTRAIRVIKVWLHASILNVDHVLLVKAKWQKGKFDAMTKDSPISMRMSVDQDWPDAVEEALSSRLGLNRHFQQTFLAMDRGSHKVTEEVGYSRSYPGLKTLYVVNEVTVRVSDSEAGACHLIGLPFGTDFTFSRRESLSKGPEADDIVVTHWSWKTQEGFDAQRTLQISSTANANPTISDLADDEVLDDADTVAVTTVMSEVDLLRKRVAKPKALKASKPKDDAPASVLASLMKGKKTDWKRAKNAAARIRDPTYTCKNYYEDITAAFPELRLYCITTGEDDKDLVSSGRTADDEYQRTIGALFAVFWAMRLDMDGKESFCYGLESDWKPRNINSRSWGDVRREPDELPKRNNFYDKTDWRSITQLLMDAGLLHGSGADFKHDEDRTLAMLVMMAIHDIMKLTPLLPRVAKSGSEFTGYKPGELISDHDVALSYVLVHYPELLPSYAGLPKAQQDSVRFTHCKMEYNMGWLVQAEAPPGALFKTFREVARSGQASDSDIAFYFVHWFVDLAGAEPCPLEGCEKFVLKFPLRVLGQFLESFSVVQAISSKSETQVNEEYLKDCWNSHSPALGVSPTGPGAVAKMRLVLMSQGDSLEVLSQFVKLPEDDRLVLSNEMACTGCEGQQYACDPLESQDIRGKGPAILMYYGPALMQQSGKKDPFSALTILAEVYRKSRELWPVSPSRAGDTVTVRIDALKGLDPAAVMSPEAGHIWVVSKTSGKDAMVKLLGSADYKGLDWDSNIVLTFGIKRTTLVGKTATSAPARGRPSLVSEIIPKVRRFSLFSSHP